MVIPEAAVEAALSEVDRVLNGELVGGAADTLVRVILEAASPHMVAEVTTRAEQVNLPNGTVILSEQGGIFQHFNGYWFEPASSYRHHLDDITLPATVVHRPTP